MPPLTAKWNTSVVKPSTWRRTLTLSNTATGPYDLTGYSALFVVFDLAGAEVFRLTSDEGDGITILGAAGTIELVQQTADLPEGCFKHSLELTQGDETDPTVGEPEVWVVAMGQFKITSDGRPVNSE